MELNYKKSKGVLEVVRWKCLLSCKLYKNSSLSLHHKMSIDSYFDIMINVSATPLLSMVGCLMMSEMCLWPLLVNDQMLL
jgi:hypothetical protein